MTQPAPGDPCCGHADDAAKWRRVEYAIERAASKGGLIDAEELFDLAQGE